MSTTLQTQSLHPAVAGFPRRRNMTITQTYYLAHTARGKLSMEASRADHNLRLLVGHANLLDSLMLDLAEAEQEQESWFNQSVKSASPKLQQQEQQQSRHIQWADAIIEEEEMDEDSSDSDSDSDFDDEDTDVKMEAAAAMISMHRVSARSIPSEDYDSDEEEDVEDDGAEDYAALSLTLSPSHSQSPPELAHDDDSSSDDDSMPPSPPSTVLPSFSDKQRQQIATTAYYEDDEQEDHPHTHAPLSTADQNDFIEKGYFLPQRRTPSQGLVSAISVY